MTTGQHLKNMVPSKLWWDVLSKDNQTKYAPLVEEGILKVESAANDFSIHSWTNRTRIILWTLLKKWPSSSDFGQWSYNIGQNYIFLGHHVNVKSVANICSFTFIR